jgi:hypothetical protein
MEGSAVLGLANSTHCLEVLGILEQIIYSIQFRREGRNNGERRRGSSGQETKVAVFIDPCSLSEAE